MGTPNDHLGLYIIFSPPPSVVSNQCNSPLHHVIPHYTNKSWDPIALQLHCSNGLITVCNAMGAIAMGKSAMQLQCN